MNPLGFVVAAPLVAALAALAIPAGAARRGAKVIFAALAALALGAMAGRVDALSLGFAALVSTLGFLAVAFSVGGAMFERRSGDIVGDPDETVTWSRVSVYYVLLGAFWSAMLLVVLADNFSILWLGISATTLATAFLVGFAGEAESLEAAWKYLVLCSVGIGFALFGLMVLAHVTLALGLDPAHALSWAAIVQHPPLHPPPLARLAIALMTIGFATKAGLVPMHAWLPDAHSKAPAPVSGLLSGVLVSCALYALMRTLSVATALGAGPLAHSLLLWLGALSTVVAGALMLTQTDLKRLLAYSTVEHAGIVALALGFGGKLGTFAALAHLLAHAFAKSAAFLATGLVQRERRTTALVKLRGLWQSGPGGRMLLAALTALGGLPPFGIFVSELLVIAAGAISGEWTALILGLIGMALAFAALSRAAIEIESGRAPALGEVRAAAASRASAGAAAVALCGALAVAVAPWTPLGNLMKSVAAALGGQNP